MDTDIDIRRVMAHEGLVRRLALGALGRDRDVEDVVRDTWLAALRAGPEKPGAVRSRLARVVRNRAISGARRRASADRWRDSLGEPESPATRRRSPRGRRPAGGS
jgi:DNA-directed RNA polymerase specialized sigma24 family protein